jgi:hypothetical protein
MPVPGIHNGMMLASGGYKIPRSLRSRLNTWLSRTYTTGTGSTTHWVSMWVKRGQLIPASTQVLFGAANATTSSDLMYFLDDQLSIVHNNSGVNFGVLTTTQRFRDTSAWYHIYYVHDSRDATAANRMRLWVNGVEVTSFSARTNIATQNSTLASWMSNNADPHEFGRNPRGGIDPYDGLFADVVCGQGGNPPPVTTFGHINPQTGAWVPKKIGTGTVVFGTTGNGFYLPFSNNTSLSTLAVDASGNGRNWTSNHFLTGVANDSLTDSPTNNHCTLSPEQPALDPLIGGLATSWLNLSWSSSASAWVFSSGKLFYEIEAGVLASSPTQSIAFGWARFNTNNFPGGYYAGSVSGGYGVVVSTTNVLPYNDAIALTASQITGTYATGAKFRCAIDFDAGKLWFGTTTAWCGGGNPEAGTSPTYTFTPGTPLVPVLSAFNTLAYINFGQQPWQTTRPPNFLPMCAESLSQSTIRRGNTKFDIALATGSNLQTAVNALTPAKDLRWVKNRSTAGTGHVIWDSARGATARLDSSDSSAGESTFTYGNLTGGDNCVAWVLEKGATTGFDIVTYTGNGVAGRQIAHGLGATLEMIIVRRRNGAGSWRVYHFGANANPQNGCLFLEGTQAFTTASIWNNTAPTSSVFTVSADPDVNGNGNTYVAYLFHSVPGFSSFGWYQGNGSTNGPYIPLSFRPRWLMVKRASGGVGDWTIYDTARDRFNETALRLFPNLANAETTGVNYDLYSKGFKPRNNIASLNNTNDIYVFASFAEMPRKFSNAR